MEPLETDDVSNATDLPSANRTRPPMLLDDIPYVVLVNGYLSPALVAFTLVTNVCVCAVLLRPNMRSSTNILLVAMAVSDTLTGLCPLPAYFRFYSGGDGAHLDWVPYTWCFAYYCLTDHLPTIFHTASVWLTVTLAAQRYVYVCRAVDARRLCTVRNSVRAIVVIYVVAVCYQLGRFVETRYIEAPVESLTHDGLTVVGCRYEYWSFLNDQFIDAYFNVYYWFRVVFVHLVPCSALVALNAALVLAMRRAQARRRMLLAQNRKTESRRLAESNVTTMMLVAVVGVFLIVEFPLSGLFIVVIVENTFNMTIIYPDNIALSTLCVNLFILLSYPVNFFIYCGMSRQFRGNLKALFLCQPDDLANTRTGQSLAGGGEEVSRYVSLTALENGRPVRTSTTVQTKTTDGSTNVGNDEKA